jgi:hypothetical protein
MNSHFYDMGKKEKEQNLKGIPESYIWMYAFTYVWCMTSICLIIMGVPKVKLKPS